MGINPAIYSSAYIETNGFGSSVLAQLVKTKIKRNLYYEIKDRVFEERSNMGMSIQRNTRKVKVYGFDETPKSRDLLMDILRQRMDHHKGKFISPIIYSELCTLEVKKNGRIEHASNAHDDQIFSYLLALYIWYEGKDLMERYGLQKGTLSSDDDITIEAGIEEQLEDISADMSVDTSEIATETKAFFDSNKSISYDQWRESQQKADLAADEMLRNNPRTREAWYIYNHLNPEDVGSGVVTLPNSIFDSYYEQDIKIDPLQAQFDSITDLR